MRIVHIITRLLKAGAEENTLFSCISQAEAGHEVYLLHGSDYIASYYDEIKTINFIEVPSLVHPISPIDDWKGYRQITNILKEIKPDIVHTHQSKAGIIGRFAAKSAGVPIIINGIHIVPFVSVSPAKEFIYKTAEKLAARCTDFNIDVSRGVKDVYVTAGIGTEEDHEVIHSGFDLKKFQNAEPLPYKEIEGLAHFEEKPPIILMLAAYEPRKRHEAFLAAMPRLLEKIPNAQLLFVGTGPHEAAVRAAIKTHGLEKSVHMLGYRTDPEKLIALSDICTLVSEREGLPRVLMQYLATGKPCVATDLPGLDEVLFHDTNGLLLPGDDVEGVVEKITDILSNTALLERLSKGAKATQLDSWKTEDMCTHILKVYEQLARKYGINVSA